MNYNSPFIRMLETIANMLIVSFLWLIFSLPVITLVSSSCALYHTTNKIIFGPGRGNGVWKDFFESYKLNLIPGIKLTLLVIVAGLFVAEGLWTGYQIYKINIWGMLYMLLGILVSVANLTASTWNYEPTEQTIETLDANTAVTFANPSGEKLAKKGDYEVAKRYVTIKAKRPSTGEIQNIKVLIRKPKGAGNGRLWHLRQFLRRHGLRPVFGGIRDGGA